MNYSKSQVYNSILGIFLCIKKLSRNLFLILLFVFISSCSKQKDNFEIDISKLNLPKKNLEPKVNLDTKSEKETVAYKLKTLQKKDEIIKNTKFGQVDPFSMGNGDSNNLISNFKLQGFISINNKNHALVKYKEKTGVINIDSIGGLNTKLIPLDSYVKEINPQEEELIIMIDNEKYNINLGK